MLYFTFTRSSAPDQQAFIPVALLDQYAGAKLAEYKAQLLARAATLRTVHAKKARRNDLLRVRYERMNAQTLVRRLNLSWFELNDPEKRALVIAELGDDTAGPRARELWDAMDELAQEMVR